MLHNFRGNYVIMDVARCFMCLDRIGSVKLQKIVVLLGTIVSIHNRRLKYSPLGSRVRVLYIYCVKKITTFSFKSVLNLTCFSSNFC